MLAMNLYEDFTENISFGRYAQKVVSFTVKLRGA